MSWGVSVQQGVSVGGGGSRYHASERSWFPTVTGNTVYIPIFYVVKINSHRGM